MTKLKTLKDFETDQINLSCNVICNANSLKQEAIKWIKKLKTGITLEDAEDYIEADQRKNTIRWIKHFFNITEDNLKKR